MDLKEMRQGIVELIEAIKDTDIAEIEIEDGKIKLRIKRAPGVNHAVNVAERVIEDAIPAASVSVPADGKKSVRQMTREDLMTITAPMVGTFYRSPSPGADPYVEIGDVVEAGQPVCIIEAMKVMNEIVSEVKGRVVEILAENSQPVEYGQVLFVLERI
ncbi:MAG: acetyl-CoA carboxylase biotin carboxyl carrier protein [Firmicutes bacterium]|nr:acetyl-CoA carboxylase biotin carboxyl carrier protein [Bacillota bacterium]